jgi:dihydroflavonol-4-reductase
MEHTEQVLVTGGSGFIASHCIALLLQNGYRVKTTVRSLTRTKDIKSMLKVAGIRDFSPLSFVEADLSKASDWTAAAEGCTYIIHPASPTPGHNATTEEEFVTPAVNGVLFVLRAAKAAGVKRVVLTSAFGAVGMGTNKTTPYTEDDWTDLNAELPFYQRSKTLAEKAAWEYIATEGKGLELAVVNPVGVLGPVLDADYSHSIRSIHTLLNGEMKGLPKMSFGYVDVRDVADLHVRAMTHANANGERFLAVAGKAISMLDIARILREAFPEKAARIPKKETPSWLIRTLAIVNPKLRFITPFLGFVKEVSHEKATRLLGWQPRSNKEAVIATAESLIRLGLVK